MTNAQNIASIKSQRKQLTPSKNACQVHINPISVKTLESIKDRGHKFTIKPWAEQDVQSFIQLNLAQITKVSKGHYVAKITNQGKKLLKKVIFPDHTFIHFCKGLSIIFTTCSVLDAFNIWFVVSKMLFAHQQSKNSILIMAVSGIVLLIAAFCACCFHKIASIYRDRDINSLSQKKFIHRSVNNKIWMHLRFKPSAKSFFTMFRN